MISDFLTNPVTQMTLASLTLAGIFLYLWWTLAMCRVGGLSERGIPVSAGSTREDGRPNTSSQASTPRSLSLIILVHEGEFYPCGDWWDVVETSRTLAEIQGLPETTGGGVTVSDREQEIRGLGNYVAGYEGGDAIHA